MYNPTYEEATDEDVEWPLPITPDNIPDSPQFEVVSEEASPDTPQFEVYSVPENDVASSTEEVKSRPDLFNSVPSPVSLPDETVLHFQNNFTDAARIAVQSPPKAPTSGLVEGGGSLQDKMKAGMNDMAEKISGEKPFSFQIALADRIDETVNNFRFEDDKLNYLWQTGAGQSLTSQVLRNNFNVKLDPDMEKDLTISDMILRQAMALGPDLPLLALGGTIPSIYRSGAVAMSRSLPILAKVGPNASWREIFAASAGFLQGAREIYNKELFDGPLDEDGNRMAFIEKVGSSLYRVAKEYTMGYAMGAGAEWRGAAMKAAPTVFEGIAKASGEAVIEAPIIASLMSQMHSPGMFPEAKDFAASVAMMIGLNTLPSLGAGYRSFFEMYPRITSKVRKTSERNGVRPEDIAADVADGKIAVMEDMVNPMKETITAYDAEGGFVEPRPSVLMALDEATDGARGIVKPTVEPTSGLVSKDAEAQMATGAPAPPQQPAPLIPVVKDPGKMYPIEIFVGEPVEEVLAPNGMIVVLPVDYRRSLALSDNGVMTNPMLINLAEDLGIPVAARTEGKDPFLQEHGPGEVVNGYFMSPEGAVDRRIKELSELIGKFAKDSAKMSRQDFDPAHVANMDATVARLQGELDTLNSRKLRMSDGIVVLNSALQSLPPNYTLKTLGHEIGHVIGYMNEGWGDRRTVGLSDNFYSTLSGFPGMIEDIITWAGNNGVNPQHIKAEGVLLSRMWRPTTNSMFMSSAYRSSGAEMIADVTSIMLNNPDIVKNYAPNLHSAMTRFFEARPEAKDYVANVLDIIRNGGSREDTEARMAASADLGEVLKYRRIKDVNAGKQQVLDAEGTGFGEQMIDQFFPVNNFIKNGDGAINKLQKYQFRNTPKALYVHKVSREVMTQFNKLGLSNTDVHLLGLYRTIIGSPNRKDVYNPRLIDPAIANQFYQEKITELALRAGIPEAEMAAGVAKAFDDFHQVRLDTIIKKMNKSGLFGDEFIDNAMNNSTYAYMQNLEHIIEGDAKLGLERTKGSPGDVLNTFSSTLELDLWLHDMIDKKVALKSIVEQGLASGEYPVIPVKVYKSIVGLESEADILQGYSRSMLAKVELPVRIRKKDRASGSIYYVTGKRSWMIPAKIMETFDNSHTGIQLFMSQVANHTVMEHIGNVFRSVAAGKEKSTTRAVAQLGTKLMNVDNTVARYSMLLLNAGWLMKNMLFYDPLKSATLLPINPKNPLTYPLPVPIPFGGSVAMMGYRAKAVMELLKSQITGDFTPKVTEMFEEGIYNAVSRYNYNESESTSVMTDRIVSLHSPSGYNNRIAWKSGQMLNNLGSFLRGTVQGIGNIAGNMEKTAVSMYLDDLRADGLLNNLSKDKEQILNRTTIGEPPYSIRGRAAAAMGHFYLFYASIVSATRFLARGLHSMGTLESAAKISSVVIAPVIYATLLKLGYFDSEYTDEERQAAKAEGKTLATASEILAGVGDSVFATNFVIPVGISPEGDSQVITLPYPQDALYRLLSVMTSGLVSGIHHAQKEDPKNPKLTGAIGQLLDVASSSLEGAMQNGYYAIPELSPSIKSMSDAFNILVKDNVKTWPDDKDKYSHPLVGAAEKGPAILQAGLERHGVDKNIREVLPKVDKDPYLVIKPEERKQYSNGFMNRLAGMPFVGKGFTSFYKETSQGHKDSLAKEGKELEKARHMWQRSQAAEDFAKKNGLPVPKEAVEEKKKAVSFMMSRGKLPGFTNYIDKNVESVVYKDNKYLQEFQKSGNMKATQDWIFNASNQGVKTAEVAWDVLVKSGKVQPRRKADARK